MLRQNAGTGSLARRRDSDLVERDRRKRRTQDSEGSVTGRIEKFSGPDKKSQRPKEDRKKRKTTNHDTTERTTQKTDEDE